MGNDKSVAHIVFKKQVSYFVSYYIKDYQVVVVGIDANSDNTLVGVGPLFR